MKSRTALVLMEQMIMLLVLAVAAAVCLRVFVYADTLSKKNAAAEIACRQAQSAAETLKGCRGDLAAAAERFGGTFDGEVWVVHYDAHWQLADGGEYTLTAEKTDSGTEYLGRARITVAGAKELFSLEVCWQEDA